MFEFERNKARGGHAEAMIAAQNRVECRRDTTALDLKPGGGAAFTVLGNIVGGSIMVNNAALPAPWQPLNVFGV